MQSKLIISPFIFISLILVIPFAILGLPNIFSTIYQLKNGLSNDVTGIILPIIFLVLICYLIITFINLFPKLSINENGIKLSSISRKSFHRWEEIEKISLSGKKEFSFFMSIKIEAVTFYLKNGEEIFFWIDQYSNSSEIRLYLEKNKEKLIDKPLITNDVNSYYNDINIESIIKEKKTYNDDNMLTQDRFFIYIIFLINLIFVCVSLSQFQEYYFLIILSFGISLILIYVFSFDNNYFILTAKNIIIKNNILWWKQKKININDIKEIVIEQHRKAGVILRVITKEYETHIIGASSLKKNTWKKLTIDLSKKNILIRNEIKYN